MTTLENRPNTALLVIDVQNGVVAGAYERDAVVANVDSLVEKARRGRDPRRGRAHDGGSHGMGCASAGGGHRAHEPLLDRPQSAGPDGRDGRDEGG
jgi:hypothetical protein